MDSLVDIANNLETDWSGVLATEDLAKIESEIDFETSLPRKELIFNAFNHFNINELKLVILGQDPYPNPEYPNGLAFSVNDGIKLPGSLRNIFKKLKEEELISEIPKSGNLEYLAKQGVLLLNTALTVETGNAGSHVKLWKKYTDNIIKYINDNLSDVVFLLMGGKAKVKKKFIDLDKHRIVAIPHPSPLSYKLFMNSESPFNTINEYLDESIVWGN